MREMRAIAFVTSLIESGRLTGDEFKLMHVHSIRADEQMVHHDPSSKMNANWEFLTHLRDQGRAHAKSWLDSHYERIGNASTVDVRGEFL